MFTLEHQIVLHQVEEACVDVATLSHGEVEVKSLQVAVMAHKNVIEVPVQMRVVLDLLL